MAWYLVKHKDNFFFTLPVVPSGPCNRQTYPMKAVFAWGRRQLGYPNCCIASLHGVTTQKTLTSIFTTVKTWISNLFSILNWYSCYN